MAVSLLNAAAHAQWSYPGCDDLKPGDFAYAELFNKKGDNAAAATDPDLAEPVAFDIVPALPGQEAAPVSIFFVERLGKVKYYDGNAKQVTEVGKIPVHGEKDNGLMGVAVDPGFHRNRFIYTWHSPPLSVHGGENRWHHLTRWTITPDFKLGEDRTLIENMGSLTDAWHAGGPMTFDDNGDLWITYGNNSLDHGRTWGGGDGKDPFVGDGHLSHTDKTGSDEWGSSSTANLRGGILRIHPDPQAPKGYTVPSGNFGEYWAARWEEQGNTALAAEYRDPSKVLPEIYAKGHRSNYSIGVHPTGKWLAWGDVNPPICGDEYNLVDRPVFAGYPYFCGDDVRTNGHEMTPDSPRNTSPFNAGVTELPPAVSGKVNGMAKVAMSGPIYAYDRNLDSPVKWPPHLHNHWITMDFANRTMEMHSIDSATLEVRTVKNVEEALFRGLSIRGALGGRFGPDGAFYLHNYDGFYNTRNPSIIQVAYKGDCELEPVSIHPSGRGTGGNLRVRAAAGALLVEENGKYEIELYDRVGRRLFYSGGKGPARYSLREAGLHHGLYTARVRTEAGTAWRIVAVF